MKIPFLFSLVSVAILSVPAWGASDLVAPYMKDINGEAKAKTTRYRSAWGKNMSYQIKRKVRDGIVVDSSRQQITNKYISDGLGNVIIRDGARVNTVVNESTIKDTTIILQNTQNSQKSRY